MKFYVGLHQPSDARHFERAFISVNRLRKRRSPFAVAEWIMDSGAFTEIATHGHYRSGVAEYAAEIRRWADCGQLVCAVAQDMMCEPWIVARTGLAVADHQRITVERFDALLDADPGAPIMPVLQGYHPSDYRRHLEDYGDRLGPGAYVGVGSVCKRNADPAAVLAVLDAIATDRPDLQLHGFGLKATALACDPIVRRLYSADSMAWSYAARRQGRNGNDWREAEAFAWRIATQPRRAAVQMTLDMGAA